MADRGRLWAACLTAAASASTAVSFAGPPAGGYDLRMPGRYAGEIPATGRNEARSGNGPAINPQRAGSQAIVGFPSLSGSREGQPVGRRGAVHEFVRPSATGWVALVGEFSKSGSYEIAGGEVSLPELLERSGGLTPRAGSSLRLVRNGRPMTIAPGTAASPLRAGDVLIASGPAGRYGVATVGYEDRAAGGGQQTGVPIGIVGATERPFPLRLDESKATVGTVLAGLGQTHLRPQDVTVLLGGTQKAPGHPAQELTPGSVVIFHPHTVNLSHVAASGIEGQTHFYPVLTPPSELPAEAVSQLAVPAETTEAMLTSAPAFGAPSDNRVAAAQTESLSMVPPPPSADDELSALPEVESLDPPADAPPLGFGRVADASGSMPIGRPDVAEPHITAVPAESLYGSTRVAMAEAAPMPPGSGDSLGPATSSLGPADAVGLKANEEPIEEELSVAGLAITILIGGGLGAATFLILRRLRGRELLAFATDRLRARIGGAAGQAGIEQSVAATRGTAPADLLAALVADRLAFREERIELPAVLRVFGRSTAARKRRIDPAEASVPQPHIPLTAPKPTEAAETGSAEVRAAKKAATKMNLRIDPAEPIGTSGIESGTPFERALAARQRAGQGSR